MTAVTTTSMSDCGVGSAAAAAPRATKQLFNLLDEQSKERVVRALTAFRTLTLLEKEAFAQELGVSLPNIVQQSYAAGKRPLSGPALRVRARDQCYVTLTAPVVPNSAENADAELTAMIMPFLTEKTVFDSPEKEKEKVEEDGAVDDNAEEKKLIVQERSPPSAGSVTEGVNAVERVERKVLDGGNGQHAGGGEPQPFLYRSRAYQAMRLSRDDQQDPGTDSFTRPSVMNLTGMPIDEADLWEWFELLDVTRTGTIGVVPFLAAIKDLDRNFGVGEKAEADFAREVEALSTNGLLTFDKFAFLVSRFVRE